MAEEDNKSNNTKIAVTAIMTILFGFVFILALILFGMRVQNNIDAKKEEKKRSEEIVTINSVDFTTSSFAYKAPDSAIESKNYLINKIKNGAEQDYLVINSNSMLEDVMNAIRGTSGDNTISYSVDENFFNSGSVIAVTREASKLGSFEVKTVTRDADYNLQIDATEKIDGENPAEGYINGYVVFVKISNIQPKNIEVKVTKEE